MKKLFVAVVLLVVFALPTAACWLPPESFTVQVQEQDRVFTFEPAAWEPYATASVSLSEADGSEIWRIDDFPSLAFEESFAFSSNMNEFAFFVADTHVYALKLYADGQLQFVYRVDDFIEIDEDGPVLSIGHHWLEEYELDVETNLLTLTTTQGDVHVIDLSRRADTHIELIQEICELGNYATGERMLVLDATPRGVVYLLLAITTIMLVMLALRDKIKRKIKKEMRVRKIKPASDK
ncbi:MAG: hypothetical protein FWD06_07070 [Oscillospiraceae bacterium]|nr:hypothetical protein [Oscillospiraceae bacterium]